MHRASCPDGSGRDFDSLALGVLNLVHHLCRPGISRPGRADVAIYPRFHNRNSPRRALRPINCNQLPSPCSSRR